MKKIRVGLTLAAATGLLTLGLTGSAPAAMAMTVCNIEVDEIHNSDLQEENNDGDEIKVKLGDTMHGAWDFTAGQTRNTSLGSPDENFILSVPVVMYEVDAITRSTIATRWLSCSYGEHTVEFSGNGAIYELSYTIT